MSGQKKGLFGTKDLVDSCSSNKTTKNMPSILMKIIFILFVMCVAALSGCQKDGRQKESYGCVERVIFANFINEIKLKDSNVNYILRAYRRSDNFLSNSIEGDFSPGTCYKILSEPYNDGELITSAKIIQNESKPSEIKKEIKQSVEPKIIIIYGKDKDDAMMKLQDVLDQHKKILEESNI